MQEPSNLQSNVGKLPHPTAVLLNSHQKEGVSFVSSAKPWDGQWKEEALCHGAHQSAYQCLEFVQTGEFVNMIKKCFWTVLLASLVLHHKELRLTPFGVLPQHKQQPHVICNYAFFSVNQDTMPMAPLDHAVWKEATF